MTPEVLVIGAGAVGLAMLAPALHDAGCSVTVVCGERDVGARHRRIDALRDGYELRTTAESRWLRPSRAIDRDDADAVVAAGSRAALWCFAVGRDQASSAAVSVRTALACRRRGGQATDILVCENAVDPAALVEALARDLNVDGRDPDVRLIPTVNDGIAAIELERGVLRACRYLDAPIWFCAKARHRGPPAALRAPAFVPTDDLVGEARRKLLLQLHPYDGAAFLAATRGHRDMAAALVDPVVHTTAVAALDAVAPMVGDPRRTCLARALLASRAPDPVARNCRGSLRKLAPGERLLAPLALVAARGGDVGPATTLLAAAILVAEAAWRRTVGLAVAAPLRRALDVGPGWMSEVGEPRAHVLERLARDDRALATRTAAAVEALEVTR